MSTNINAKPADASMQRVSVDSYEIVLERQM